MRLGDKRVIIRPPFGIRKRASAIAELSDVRAASQYRERLRPGRLMHLPSTAGGTELKLLDHTERAISYA